MSAEARGPALRRSLRIATGRSSQEDEPLASPKHRKSFATEAGEVLKALTTSWTQQPAFLQFNKHVHLHYRRHPISFSHAAFSLVGYLHNETLNIYTHLLPGVLCAYWFLDAVRSGRYATGGGLWAVQALADLTSATCFLLSAWYHTFMPVMTQPASYAALIHADVWGVWAVNVGAALSVTLLLFPCVPPGPSHAAWAAVRTALIVIPVGSALFATVSTARTPATRAQAFALCWAVRLASILASAAFSLSPTGWPHYRLALHVLAELCPVVGAAINLSRWPEVRAPGRYDLANSHTLFHVLVAVCMLSQHWTGSVRIEDSAGVPGLAECAHEQWGGAVVGAMRVVLGWGTAAVA